MKLKNITLAIASSTMLLTTNAFASDGTVNFTGEIVTSTCVVSNGSQGVQTVNLGQVSARSLATAGSTAAATQFSIGLSGCSANTKASIKFDGTPDLANSSILAVTGGATNVGIGLYESDSATALPLLSASKQITTNEQGAGTFNFVAKYVSTGQVTSGKANASATFSIIYN
ncbi:fimbrial protein [Orbus mooreae]|uniref:fimbrial protein n=1 Tax=Orbus mooreae TaxID=3074107 RepID=UPI00370D5827